MELIDRQATLEKIDTLCKAYALHEPAIQKCREIVEKQPAIEPEVMSNESVYDILCRCISDFLSKQHENY